jgi:PAS domain S-box-containing protein
MSFSFKRQPWILLLAVFLAVYITALLVNAFRSQAQLYSAAEARLLADNQQTAAVISDFVADQKHFVINLAENHEIQTYLTNEALGMSMRYGLNANLYAIETSFQSKLVQKTAFGAPLYKRILYLDPKGSPLVDTNPEMPPVTLPQRYNATPQWIIDDPHGQIIAMAPVDNHGAAGGTVMTVADLDLLSRYQAKPSINMGFRQILLTETGRELTTSGKPILRGMSFPTLAKLSDKTLTPIASVPTLGVTSLGREYDLMLRTPVPGTALSLLTLLPESTLYGHITSRQFLYFASAVPLLLLLIALGINHIRQRTQRLEAEVIESNRNRAELQDHNQALTLEMARREALENELRESEERFKLIAETIDEVFWMANVQMEKMLYISPGYKSIWGRTCESLYNNPRSFIETIHPEDFERVLSDWEVKKTGKPFSHEYRILRPDGSIRWILDRGYPITDKTGRVCSYVGVAQDITERRQADEELRFRSMLLDTAVDSMIVIDLDGHSLYMNEATWKTRGYTRDELLGIDISELDTPEFAPLVPLRMKELIAVGQVQFETAHRCKDGHIMPIEINARTIESGGRKLVFGALRDITERKKSEAELRQHQDHLEELVIQRTAELVVAKEAAEAANVAKSAFLANMSHEIRTPMNGVLGMAHMLRRTGVTPQQAGYLDKIETSGKHLLDIINDILDLSKIEAGKLHLEQHDFTLPEMIHDIMAIVGDRLHAKGLSLRVLVAGAPHALRGDRT